jgi:RNA polymerase sigma factor (sigma-70 family)
VREMRANPLASEDNDAATDRAEEFSVFVRRVEPILVRSLVAAYGVDDGRDACAAALAWGWENWDKLQRTQNPTGYLFRVGQTAFRKVRRKGRLRFPPPGHTEIPQIEPKLPELLSKLTHHQRAAVLLVHAYEYTLEEVSETLRISPSSVRNHLRRGMSKLQKGLGVRDE